MLLLHCCHLLAGKGGRGVAQTETVLSLSLLCPSKSIKHTHALWTNSHATTSHSAHEGHKHTGHPRTGRRWSLTLLRGNSTQSPEKGPALWKLQREALRLTAAVEGSQMHPWCVPIGEGGRRQRTRREERTRSVNGYGNRSEGLFSTQ